MTPPDPDHPPASLSATTSHSTHNHTHTHTQSLEFPKPSQASFFCPSDQSSPGVERDLTRGRGGGPCCLASRRCGKRQTGSSSDGPAILPRADGALNPRRILKATHDRGGRLFCHHHAHTHTHTLEETHTHTVSFSRRLFLPLCVGTTHSLSSSAQSSASHGCHADTLHPSSFSHRLGL